MAKYYTVKDIARILTEEFGDNPASYQFTEERVRARLRSAKARGIITPIRLGFDRRTKYYTEEDVQRLMGSWVGPEIAEFTDYEEDLKVINPDEEEIEVRAATIKDLDAILQLFRLEDAERDNLSIYVSKMLKTKQSANFVALFNESDIIGWSQAEISTGLSMLQGTISGTVRVNVPADKKGRLIAVRSLILRARDWLFGFGVKEIILEIPSSMADLEDLYIQRISMDKTSNLVHYQLRKD